MGGEDVFGVLALSPDALSLRAPLVTYYLIDNLAFLEILIWPVCKSVIILTNTER